MATGTVKWFNQEKGFGFIVDPETGSDIFVHYSEIQKEGYRTLQEGERVEYELYWDEKGAKARSVVSLDAEIGYHAQPPQKAAAPANGNSHRHVRPPGPSFATWDEPRKVIPTYPQSVKSYLSLLLQSLQRGRTEEGADQKFLDIATEEIEQCLNRITERTQSVTVPE